MENNLFQLLVAAIISAAIATRSYRRKSLDLSGAIAGFAIMTIHIAVNYRYFFSYILKAIFVVVYFAARLHKLLTSARVYLLLLLTVILT